jgi:uncharacterized protein
VIVAVARLSLRIPHSHSLKEKRSVLRSLKDKTRAKLDVKLAEVDGQDTWQSAALGFALVGSDRAYLESQLDRVVRFVEDQGIAEIVGDDREVLYFGDEEAGGLP